MNVGHDQRLKEALAVVAGLGSVIPGMEFFRRWAPPLLPQVTLVTALAAVFLLAAAIWKEPGRARRLSRRELVRALALPCVGFLMALLYVVGYQLTTVAPPPQTMVAAAPCQTGLDHLFLTEAAMKFVAESDSPRSRRDLMLAFGTFPDCESGVIWQQWSVIVAGVCLVLLFASSCLLWSFGFGRLVTLLRRTGAVALAVALLGGCAPLKFTPSHASFEERIEKLEAKVEELDERAGAGPAPERKEPDGSAQGSVGGRSGVVAGEPPTRRLPEGRDP